MSTKEKEILIVLCIVFSICLGGATLLCLKLHRRSYLQSPTPRFVNEQTYDFTYGEE